MIASIAPRLALSLALLALTALPIAAQPVPMGVFTWQLAPFCNVVSLTTAQTGAVYTFDGTDNQCGASTMAPVRGLAVLNPNGTVGIGLTIVTSPGALPVHVQGTIDLATFGGPWTDDHGNSGTFVFAPATPSGSPRPVVSAGIPAAAITNVKLAPDAVDASKVLDGSIGYADVNVAEVQRRVDGVCPTDQLMTGVNADGTVACAAVASGAGGDITGVAAGVGLTGGGATGDVTLNVNTNVMQVRVAGTCAAGESIRAVAANGTVTCETDDVGTGDITGVTASTGLSGGGTSGTVALSVQFAGSGSAATAARADHTHAGVTANNTAIGMAALAAITTGHSNTALGETALTAVTTGDQNTAAGVSALAAVTTGGNNVGLGFHSADATTTGFGNTSIGALALRSNTSGGGNTVVGYASLNDLASGGNNAVLGYGALADLTSGSYNVAVGSSAGQFLTGGSNNVYLASWGAATDDATIRIGNANQTRAFMTGVRGVTTGQNNAQTVVVDSNGQLGTVSSSAKTKFDIQDLPGDVTAALSRLRPVSFRYKQAFGDGSTPVQYGLIAEEVQQVLPELVALDGDGQPASVKYHVLPALLLAEVQRLQAALADQATRTAMLEQALTDLRLVAAARER